MNDLYTPDKRMIAKITLNLTRGHGLIMDLSGPRNKDARQKLMVMFKGEPVPKAKAGVTALNAEFINAYDIEPGTIRQQENDLSEALKRSATQ